jgi:glutathionylspermidine synthase
MTLSYAERRRQLYEPLREEEIFTWDFMHDEEYALASIHLVSAEFRREIAQATEQLGHIFAKTLPVLQQAEDRLLRELGIPDAALDAVRLAIGDDLPTVIGRFDFACTPAGLKMLEFNSDTPTGVVEAFHVNEFVCRMLQTGNPNAGHHLHIKDAFQQAKDRYQSLGYPTKSVFFSALDWHEEDAGTTRYLLAQSGLKGEFAPLSELRVYQDRLHVLREGEHMPVDLLYRLHALEKLAEEHDDDGYPTGAHVLDLIARRQLAVINPPAAFLAQTKALQALIWNLHETGQFFTPDEQEAIAAYMLPTYLENRFLGKKRYVSKPIFGREGGGVTLHQASGEAFERDRETQYWDQPMVYQQFVELEPIQVETLRGMFSGHLLWGSFWVGGRASAILARAGHRITGNLSYYLPVGLRD